MVTKLISSVFGADLVSFFGEFIPLNIQIARCNSYCSILWQKGTVLPVISIQDSNILTCLKTFDEN